MTVLRTERLTLRPFRPDDLELLVELDGDPEVLRFVTGGRTTPREELEQDLPVMVARNEQPDGYGYWAAFEGDAFAGWFHLRPAPGAPPDEPELGYRLCRSAWGRGLATEGSRALVDHAFGTCGARRVVAETMAVHTASRRVMERAGMTLVRVFSADWPYRIEGDEHGDVEYAVTREQWLAQPWSRPRGS